MPKSVIYAKTLFFEIQKRDSRINTLEQEKKKLLEEFDVLQNHNKGLALKLRNLGIPGEVKPDFKVNETLEYLLSRSQSKTATRVTSLKKEHFEHDDIDYVFGLLDEFDIGKDYFVFD